MSEPRPSLIDLADVPYALSRFVRLEAFAPIARLHGRLQLRSRGGDDCGVAQNLARVMNGGGEPAKLREMTRNFFEYDAMRKLLLAASLGMKPEEILERLPVEGLENLDKALEKGKGVVLLGTHLNSLCMFVTIVMLRKMGYDVRAALPEKEDSWAPSRFRSLLNRMTGDQALREAIGGFYGQFNIRPIVKALRENAIVAQTGDGWHSAKFVEVDFMGEKLPFTTGMLSVAQKTGSPVVPMFEVGRPLDDLKCIVEEPIYFGRGESPEEEIEAAVRHFAKRLEHHVLENLECWQHWAIDDTLQTMKRWPERTLQDKYSLGG